MTIPLKLKGIALLFRVILFKLIRISQILDVIQLIKFLVLAKFLDLKEKGYNAAFVF